MKEDFEILKEIVKNKEENTKEERVFYSEKKLIENGFFCKRLNFYHLRVDGRFNYWPTTGLFINIKTQKKGRGVYNLIKELKK